MKRRRVVPGAKRSPASGGRPGMAATAARTRKLEQRRERHRKAA